MNWQPAPVMPIQIRTDLTVFIQGIPWDLSKREATKLARVVEAMVNPEPPKRLMLPHPRHFKPTT
jgi:hypothetical protein